MQSLFEKLQLKDEKNLLIQGLPSSIEKQFAKLSYSKSVTPLLKSKKIDFALVFAINQNQLCNILKDVFAALHENSKLWVAYPKATSKIASDLNRECSWDYLGQNGFESAERVILDHVWSAIRFTKAQLQEIEVCLEEEECLDDQIIEVTDEEDEVVVDQLVSAPVELQKVLLKHTKAKEIFSTLSPSHKKEYVNWIQEAKRADTRQRRAEATLEKLLAKTKVAAGK